MRLAPSGRLVGTTMVAAADEVTTDLLRSVPLGRIEATINGPLRQDVLKSLEEAEDEPIKPELNFTGGHPHAEVYEMMEDTLVKGGLSPEKAKRELRRAFSAVARRKRAKLRIPDVRPYPLAFYEQVGSIYGEFASQSSRPAVEIAEANGVPVSTVHRWIKEARNRGILPEGQRGKAV
jgi:hypothetical protein